MQGIQGFIFETNKLKEIVGASELVETICTTKFEPFIKGKSVNRILTAAGNIRLSSVNIEDLKELVLKFPKEAQEFAPGITLSQSIVKSKGDDIESEDIDLLEQNLQTQRNIITRPIEISGCAIRRSLRTGKSAVSYENNNGNQSLIDSGTRQKIEQTTNLIIEKLVPDNKDFNINEEKYAFPKDMADITHRECRWLAVIHADGNNLGKRIRELSRNENKPQLEFYRQFSSKLEEATCKAAKHTFDQVIREKIRQNEIKTNKGWFPFRPIVLGGDDISVICRADLAIEFVSTYLSEFEEETKNKFDGRKITACAGISFVKESYPFHYAIHLAEQLCSAAKNKSKKQNAEDVPSSLAFHKVHASYIDSYSDIKENTLFAKESDIRFDYGPYTVKTVVDGMPHLSELTNKIESMESWKKKNEPSPKSGLRKWLSELSNNKEAADQLLDRLNIIHKDKMDELGLENPVTDDNKTIVFDILSILSLRGGE